MMTVEQIAAANKANMETLFGLTNKAIESVEKIVELNMAATKAAFNDVTETAQAALGAKDVQELVALQTSLAQPVVEKAVAYSRSIYEIASQTQEEVSKMFETQVAEANKTFAAALDKAAKSAPAGSDVAVAAVKSAIAAANSAYDSVTKAAKQVAEIAEANVAAATSATVKAVSASTPAKSSKKAA